MFPVGSLAGTPDSDRSFIDTQIYDARTGFPMKKVNISSNILKPFKICKHRHHELFNI